MVKYLLHDLFHHIWIRIGRDDEERFVPGNPACGPGFSSPPWHPYPNMELVTVAPHAQPKTHQNKQKAKSLSPDGEETAIFVVAWLDIARCLGIRPRLAKYKAVANMSDMLQALYCTYQCPNLLNCVAVAGDSRPHCTVGTASWYLLTLTIFSGDISESIKRLLSHGHKEHMNRGWGGVFQGVRVDDVSRCKYSAINKEASVQARCKRSNLHASLTGGLAGLDGVKG